MTRTNKNLVKIIINKKKFFSELKIFYFFKVESNTFKCLLAFAAGSLLADIFLHLIPEATHGKQTKTTSFKYSFSFRSISITIQGQAEDEIQKNGLIVIVAFFAFLVIEKVTELVPNAHALGTLNLVANFLDNTAHGTSVVGAFQNSIKVTHRFKDLKFSFV